MPTFPFDPRAESDTPCNAYCMAAAAGAAYLDKPELTPLLESWGIGETHVFDSPMIEGYLASGADYSIAAFRGSDHEEREDWVNNADVELVFDAEIRGGQVHSGFQRTMDSIWPQLQELISRHRKPEHPLFLTGHSLGGALAMLTAARFASESRGDEIDAIYTFGQPRVGDREFARQFDRDFEQKTFRYVNRNDLITRLPPRLMGYDHAGQLRFIDEDGELHENPSIWQQLLMALDSRGKNAREYIEELTNSLPDSVKDHNNFKYTEQLKELCPGAWN